MELRSNPEFTPQQNYFNFRIISRDLGFQNTRSHDRWETLDCGLHGTLTDSLSLRSACRRARHARLRMEL